MQKSSPSLLLLALLLCIPILSESVYTPLLPAIAHEFSAAPSIIEWTFSSYFTGFALGIIIWGYLCDFFGRRYAMLFGLCCCIFSSLVLLLSQNAYWLLVIRFSLGLGMSVCSVVTHTIIRDLYIGKTRNQIFSKIGVFINTIPPVGAILSGYIVQGKNWRLSFIILTVYCFMLFIYAYYRLSETRPVLSSYHSSFINIPLIKKLLGDRFVIYCAIVMGTTNGIWFSYYAEAPFILITLLKLSPSQYGATSIILAIAACLGSISSHRMNKRHSEKKIIEIGGLISLISFLILMITMSFSAHLHANVIIFTIIFAMSGFMFGSVGLIIPNLISNALVNYENTLGQAGSFFGFLYYAVVVTITTILGLLHDGSMIVMPLYFFTLSLMVFWIIYFKLANLR